MMSICSTVREPGTRTAWAPVITTMMASNTSGWREAVPLERFNSRL